VLRNKKSQPVPRLAFVSAKIRLVLAAATAAAVAMAVVMRVFVTMIMVMIVVMPFAFAATATATAAAAAALFKIFRLRQATELDRLRDVILDRVAQSVQFFLRIQETLRDRIRQQRVAGRFEIGDLLAAQGEGLVLLLVQRAALVHDRFVLRAGAFIAHEGVNLRPQRQHRRLGEDGIAQVLGLLQDDRVLSDG